ncbi:hypothetical protein TVAG_453950 [Trichomonas vaginalis G3]|uniref:Uncharacterized protein n=1 Tax=Trichomonas vaginalis (strain ATCC PRA-98 / G3) TaxID=412133 RepID=A2DPX1_TRIV3|nr:hypothetical protein TVAGG3_0552430 [Trichomonas vaginalis G3]EAY17567.1 hypothetical protein TVAG_453950 [Trichomonas vaginalis G3]KAI5520611.1 hypothetical protein TVAGG3_0552430 [Trichomonas vaginalis G3]|eukprot:XP_001329702.1 hypothetical protein [Trichomonas vaginalis G3]
MSDKGDVELSVSDSGSENEKKQKKQKETDEPNIVVDGQKEVHINVSDSDSDKDGSIDAQENKGVKTNPSKDPEIKPDTGKKEAKKDAQSQCCLLL